MTTGLGPRWSHVALNCRDPLTTEAFYCRHLGFRRARVVPLGAEQIVFLRSGDAYLEIFQADGADRAPGPPAGDGPRRPGTPRHIAFQTDDVDAFLAQAGVDVPITLGPLSFDDVLPGWRSVWLHDPDGVVVEVSQGFRDQSTDEFQEPSDER